MLVIVAPGQGAQTPGFLTPWLEDPVFAERLGWLSAVAGLDLAHYGTEADADTIRDTAVAQPLLVGPGLVAALALFPHPADAFGSVGAVARPQRRRDHRRRGRRRHHRRAGDGARPRARQGDGRGRRGTATGMTAVLGGDRDEVLATLEQHGLTAANDNGPGQIVAAGTVEQLAALADDPPAKARLMPLTVAGAFHTEHMAPAVDVSAGSPASVSTHDPRTRDLQPRRPGRPRRPRGARRIVSQVASPVRWDLCMETMRDLGVTGLLEMPPAGTLTGIARRALKGVETFALKTPDQLDDARAFADEHGESSSRSTPRPTWRMLVSPAKGTFHHRRRRPPAADVLAPAPRSATSRACRDESRSWPAHGGTVVEWLVEDGDPVSPGQPLVRLHPEGARHDRELRRARRRRRTPRILGLGAYRPRGWSRTPRSSRPIDSSDEWIQHRSGIKQRRLADADETVQTMSVAASREALEHAGHRRRADRLRPRRHRLAPAADARRRHRDRPRARAPTGRRLRHLRRLRRLLLRRRAGLRHGARRQRQVRAGHRRRAALRHHRPDDRAPRSSSPTAPARPSSAADEPGIGPVVWGSDGAQFDLIRQKEDWRDVVDPESRARRDAAPGDAGQPGLPLGAFEMAKVGQQALDRAGITRRRPRRASSPHQANMRIIDAMARALKLPEHVAIARDIADQGNTSAASIPLALDRMIEEGEAKSGDLALLIAFGAGLAYAAQVVTVP